MLLPWKGEITCLTSHGRFAYGKRFARPCATAYARLYLRITLEVSVHTTNLRKVGGSIMLAVPPALLDLLNLGVGAKVDIGVENGRLVVQPQVRPIYTLDELLAQCDQNDTPSDEDRAWIDATPVGKELL